MPERDIIRINIRGLKRLKLVQEAVSALYVEIQEKLNGDLLIKANGKSLKYTGIKPIARPKRKQTKSKARQAVVPKPNHPWLQGIKSVRLRQAYAK